MLELSTVGGECRWAALVLLSKEVIIHFLLATLDPTVIGCYRHGTKVRNNELVISFLLVHGFYQVLGNNYRWIYSSTIESYLIGDFSPLSVCRSLHVSSSMIVFWGTGNAITVTQHSFFLLLLDHNTWVPCGFGGWASSLAQDVVPFVAAERGRKRRD